MKKQNYLYNWARRLVGHHSFAQKQSNFSFQYYIDSDFGQIELRPFKRADTEAVLNYMYDSSETYLNSIGISKRKLPGRDLHRKKIYRRIDRSSELVAAELDNECVAVTTIQLRQAPGVPCMHFHIMKEKLRNCGLGALIFGPSIVMLMKANNLDSVYLEAKHDNLPINRVVQKLGGIYRGKGRSEGVLTLDFETNVYEVFYEALVEKYRGIV